MAPMRATSIATSLLAATALALAPMGAANGSPQFTPGSASAGDPYFPGDGNGGYDVQSYDLRLSYTPESDQLAGVATIRAKATQNLSQLNLDLSGLTVRAITVGNKPARW